MPTATVDDIAPASVPSSGHASFSDIVASPDVGQAPSGLPPPDYVAQQTTTHAQTLADRLMQNQLRQTSQWMADSPPPVPAPPIPTGLRRENQFSQLPGGIPPGTPVQGSPVLPVEGLLFSAAAQGLSKVDAKMGMTGETGEAPNKLGIPPHTEIQGGPVSPKPGVAPTLESFPRPSAPEPPTPPAQEPAQPVAAQPAPAHGAAKAADIVSPAQKPAPNLEAKLPANLRGAKPRYSHGAKQFDLNFESDLDRAAYITAQKTPSKADAAYLKFVMDATGEDEDAIRLHGGNVRAAIKTQARTAEPGTPLTVPDMARKRFAAKPAPQGTIESPGADTSGTPAKRPAPAAVDSGAARPVDAGRTGEGPAIHEPAGAGQRPGTGEATDVLIPGEQRSIPAHYAVRELSEIQSSHNGQTFAANPNYGLENERDYSKPENQQRVIEQSAEGGPNEGFQPRYHVTDNPDMANGPVLIDEQGNAIGGNSRTMHLQRVYGRDGQKAAEYRVLLEKKAAQFGIDPEVIRGMRQPVLVRVASQEGLNSLPTGAKWAVRKTNVQGQAALSSSERAAADAGQMSPEMVSHIAGAIEEAGPDATLNDALTGKSGTVIVNRLIADGFFSEQERPGLMDGKTGALTQVAKDRISKALLGKFFRDSDQISRTPASIRNKLERIAAPLAKVAGDPEWDITPELREAIDLTEFAGAHGIKNLSDVVAQTGMFGEAPKWSDGAVKLAEMLRDGKPNDVVSAFRKYVNSKEPTMFGESTPAEAFRDAFGAEKPERPSSATSSGVGEAPSGPGPTPPESGRSSGGGVPASSVTERTEKPADRPRDRGPVTLGMGLGAFEPFLRESIEDMRALKATRDAALEELERSKITNGEKQWGARVRHFFTATRDLWGARANQGIAKARKLTYASRNRRTGVDTMAEAVAIAREFKGNPEELKSILGGFHPDLARIDDPKVYERVMDRIQALRPAIERALAFNEGKPAPDAAGMKAVDQFYTNMAEMTGTEGRRVGVHHSLWNPETYVPHVLNPKGEGQYPGLRKAVGRALGGNVGKYFGFAQERTYPTLLHAVMNDVIPKTMNVHDAFTIQQDHFARARATRLLEDQLRDTNVGKYVVSKLAPVGWKPLASHAEEFKQLVPYDTGQIGPEGNAILDTAEKRLYVPDFISDALKAITAPDYTVEIMGKDLIRNSQAATKAAQLGLSLFHATTENYMALANMGMKGWAKALAADRDSGEFLEGERRLIRAGGTTAIQGNTVEAYKALSPGSIPTYQDIWRKAPAVREMDQFAHAISDFTFNNMQRRFKVTDFMLHRAAWMEKHPNAMQGELLEAERGMAKEVNAIYGGLHWENIGLNKATVEISRALMLAPDWTISNVFNVKYAFEKGPGGNMARMFWIRTLVGGMVATQAASLMFSQHFSKRPTMVYMGKDVNGEDIYQNVFFKGAPGDATNLVTNIYDYGLEGIFRTMAGKGSPTVRTGLQLATNKDYLGHEIAPKGMNPLASSVRTAFSAVKSLAPIPLSLTNQVDMLFGPESHKYKWPESLTTMFSGNPPSHVAPPGTHMSGGILRPNAEREENSTLDQMETGRVYRGHSGR
jgi:hypothetical protein